MPPSAHVADDNPPVPIGSVGTWYILTKVDPACEFHGECAEGPDWIHLTHVLAMELARYGILVNALAPGYIETDFNRAFFQTDAGKALIGRIPMKRIGQAPDLDGALLFLASPASAYVTGAVISVDGGHGVAAI